MARFDGIRVQDESLAPGPRFGGGIPLEPEAPKRDVGFIEAGLRGIGEGFAGQGNALTTLGGAIPVAIDKGVSLFTEKPSTALQDIWFKEMVDDLTKSSMQSYQVDPNTERVGTGAKVANVGGNIGAMIPSMIATGGLSSAPVTLPAKISTSMVAAQPMAVPAAVNRTQQLMDSGVDTPTAMKAGASDYAFATAMGAVPMGASGPILKRAGTGAAINVGLGIPQRGAESAILSDYPEQQQKAFDPEHMSTDALVGAIISGIMGKRAGTRIEAKPTEQPIAGALPHYPEDPFVVFPDGSTMRKSEADAAMANASVEERAKMLGKGPQEAPPAAEDIMARETIPAPNKSIADVINEVVGVGREPNAKDTASSKKNFEAAMNEVVGVKQGPDQVEQPLTAIEAQDRGMQPTSRDTIAENVVPAPQKTLGQIIDEMVGVKREPVQAETNARRQEFQQAANEVVGVKPDVNQVERPLTAIEDQTRRINNAVPKQVIETGAGARSEGQQIGGQRVATEDTVGSGAARGSQNQIQQQGQEVPAGQRRGELLEPWRDKGIEKDFEFGALPEGGHGWIYKPNKSLVRTESEALSDKNFQVGFLPKDGDVSRVADLSPEEMKSLGLKEIIDEPTKTVSTESSPNIEGSRAEDGAADNTGIKERPAEQQSRGELPENGGGEGSKGAGEVRQEQPVRNADTPERGSGKQDSPVEPAREPGPESKPEPGKPDEPGAVKPEEKYGETKESVEETVKEAKAVGNKFYSNPVADPELAGAAFRVARKLLGMSEADFKSYKDNFDNLVSLFNQNKKDERFGNPVAHILKTIGFSNDGLLRSFAKRYSVDGKPSPTITKIADMFNARPGSGEAIGKTFGEAVESHYKSMDNRLFDALGDFAKSNSGAKTARDQIRKLVQNREQIQGNSPLHKAAREIAKILDEESVYQKGSGMDIGERKNYFPRVFDTAKIIDSPVEFKAAAQKAYKDTYPEMSDIETKQMAENWYKSEMLKGMGITEQPFMDMGNSIPNANFKKTRELSKKTDTIMENFLITDPLEALRTYLRKSARKTEWERRFGGTSKNADGSLERNVRWQELQDQLVKEGSGEAVPHILKVMQSMTGELPSNVGKHWRTTASWLQAITVLKYLKHATVTSLSEPIVAGMRTGNPLNILKAYGNTAKDIANRTGLFDFNDMRQSRQIAEMLGVVVHHLSNDSAVMMQLGGGVESKAAQYLTSRATYMTGLHSYTEATRIAQVKIGQQFIRSIAEDYRDGIKRADFFLKELGVKPGQMKEFTDWVLREDDLPSAGKIKSEAMGKLYGDSILRFVDQVIMNPTPADKPYLASHPVGRIGYSLLSYLYGFQKNVIQRIGRMTKEAVTNKEFSMGDRASMLAPLAMFPLLTALQYALIPVRDQLWGDPEKTKKKTETQKWLEAGSRGNMTGALDPLFNMAMAAKYERDPATMILGAYLGDVGSLIKDVAKYPTEKNSPNTNTHERQLAKDFYNVVVDPIASAALAAQPITPLGVIGTQIAGQSSTKEAFVSAVAGDKKSSAGNTKRSSGRSSGRGESRNSGR